MYAPEIVKLPALLIPEEAKCVLGAVRLVLRILIGEGVVAAETLDNVEWLASLVAGAYVHNGGKIANVRGVREALRDGGVTVGIRTSHALVDDIAERIG